MAQLEAEPGLGPRRQPFLFLLFGLVAGIVFECWSAPAQAVVASLVAASSLTATLLFLLKKERAATIAIIAAFAAAGVALSAAERRDVSETRLKRLIETGALAPDEPVHLTGVLVAPPEPALRAYYLEVESESMRVRNHTMSATGRARLMLPLADAQAASEFGNLNLDYGSRVRVLVRLDRARRYSNPGSPDFNDFLERRGFDATGVVKSALLIESLGAARRSPFLSALYSARLRVIAAIDASFNPKAAGTLKAMLVDNRNFLDPAAMERMREAGTFHIISISGMHVGLIAWALLGGWSRSKRLRPHRAAVVLVALWAYAVMVGLAPPVVRATLMITVGLIGPLLFRRGASINTVSLAAFSMLSMKPALVADPAFQLSFTAAAAIVAIALPLAAKLRAIGEWQPSSRTPHPPACSKAMKLFAEMIFWDEKRFLEDMSASSVRFRLDKARAAAAVGKLKLQPLMRGIFLLIITSTAIQVATLPLMAFYFNRVAPVSVLINVIAGPLAALLMFAAIAALVAGAASAGLARLIEPLAAAAHDLIVNAITPFSTIPVASFRVAHYEGDWAIIYVAYFAPLCMIVALIDGWRPVDEMRAVSRATASTERRSFISSRLALAALLASMLAVLRPVPFSHSGTLVVHFLDVGQGDAALVIFPGGSTMLIDGGGEIRFDEQQRRAAEESEEAGESDDDFRAASLSVGESVVCRFLWSLGIQRVDYLLATHSDADHISGLSDVIKNFRVGQAIVGRVAATSSEFARFARAAAQRDIPLALVASGDRFEIEGARVQALWPRREPQLFGKTDRSDNNDSVVLRISYGSISFLFTGDIERQAEDEMLRSNAYLRSDVLKVPHHGSKTSSSEAFIDAVRPGYAIISVGERSRYGHPHKEVTQRYVSRQIMVLCTGHLGTVTAETDGARLDVRSYKSGSR